MNYKPLRIIDISFTVLHLPFHFTIFPILKTQIMKKFTIAFALPLMCMTLSAQITLDAGDLPHAGFNKDYYLVMGDSVDVGSAGPSQTFEFSKVLYSVYDTFTVDLMAASASPFGANHPTSTLASLTDTEVDSATQQTILELWDYVTVNATKAYSEGISIKIDTGALFSGNPPTSFMNIHTDYYQDLDFVSVNNTYNSTANYAGGWRVTIGNFKHDEYSTRSVEVDAYGTFVSPWMSFSALRFKVLEVEKYTDTINGAHDGTEYDSTYSFEYWIKDLGLFAAKAYTESTYTNVYQVELAAQIGPVGLAENPGQADFLIYPNPSKTRIEVGPIPAGEYTYRVIDATGREVLAGVIPPKTAIYSLDITALESGSYIFEMREGKNIQKRRFMVE